MCHAYQIVLKAGIKPEHIIQTLMTDVGIEGDPADLRVDPIGALLKA